MRSRNSHGHRRAALITAAVLSVLCACSSDGSRTDQRAAAEGGANEGGANEGGAADADGAGDGGQDGSSDARGSGDAHGSGDAYAGSASCQPAFGSFDVGNWPPACWRPFTDASPFNQPIPANPKLHPNSANIVSHLGAPQQLSIVDSETSPDDYNHPLYFSHPTDPLFTVSWLGNGECDKNLRGVGVRIPAAAKPASGTDHHLGVIDQATGMEYDFWDVQSKPADGGVLGVGGCGMGSVVTGNGLGLMATAGRFALTAGVFRAEELEAGVINHALFMIVKCTNGTGVYPAGSNPAAVCTDTTNAPPNGARFQLDYTDAEIDALNVPAWKKVFYRAMAKYGMIVGDTGGSSWNIFAESDRSYTSFGYPGRLRAFFVGQGATGDYVAFTGADFSRLRVIDPCVSQGTCI